MTPEQWALDPGEHVCWQVSSPQEYTDGRRALVAHAARTDGLLLVVGGAGDGGRRSRSVSVFEPALGDVGSAADRDRDHDIDCDIDRDGGRDDDEDRHGSESGAESGWSETRSRAVLRAVHKEVHAARRSGRLLSVLAGMEYVASPEASLDELVQHELDLAALAASSGTSVVCAYSRQVWKPGVVQDLAVVHSRVVGIQPRMAGFRLTCASTEAGTWSLEGSVGFESLRAFSAALRGALVRASHVRLRCAKLELIDAAGLQTLIETVAETPGSSVLLDQANETVLAAWRMSGYAATGAAVEVCA
jgi:ABC-type transporter Mla MlaB component